ncbi:hypothetical protein G9A89_016625 [Geosiphon pyriformis]|nr:hypothetical protein G9A89_016625 [Geosiphon pyriformis]
MYRRYRLLTRRLPATKPRKELTDLQVWEATDKTTIESLFIIQKTPSKPSDTTLAKPYQWKITECLGGTVNIETARENFYTELFQHTNLPRNYSFAPIIREINQTIEKYIQQQFPITYVDKGKGRIQTPTAIPKGIQLPSWKKHRVESPTAPSYHYTPGRIRSLPPQPDFGITTPWELSEEELEDQKFTYQNPITENLEQNNPNPELSNQQNLSPVIIIDQLPINLVAKLIQQLFQLPPQQPVQQQPLQQPPQQSNLDPMAYTPITKLDNFTGEEDDVQVWLNNVEKAITANGWNDA